MAFYLDQEQAIWIDSGNDDDVIYCLIDPSLEGDDFSIGLPMNKAEVEEEFGPLKPVAPTDWHPVD